MLRRGEGFGAAREGGGAVVVQGSSMGLCSPVGANVGTKEPQLGAGRAGRAGREP